MVNHNPSTNRTDCAGIDRTALPFKMDENLELWVLMNQTWQTMHKAREDELNRFQMSLKRSHFLYLIPTIAAAGKPVTPNEVVRWTLLEKHTVFETLKRMEKDGLLKRAAISRKKAMGLALTEQGKLALEQAAKRESIAAMLSVLSPEERQQLKAISKKLRDAALDISEDYTTRVLI